jgi:hypothetical protein
MTCPTYLSAICSTNWDMIDRPHGPHYTSWTGVQSAYVERRPKPKMKILLYVCILKALQDYWEKEAWKAVQLFTASIVLAMGSRSHKRYCKNLKASGIQYGVFWSPFPENQKIILAKHG